MREVAPLAAAPATERSERVSEWARKRKRTSTRNEHLRTDAGYRADQVCVRVCVRFIRTKKRT